MPPRRNITLLDDDSDIEAKAAREIEEDDFATEPFPEATAAVLDAPASDWPLEVTGFPRLLEQTVTCYKEYAASSVNTTHIPSSERARERERERERERQQPSKQSSNQPSN